MVPPTKINREPTLGERSQIETAKHISNIDAALTIKKRNNLALLDFNFLHPSNKS